MTKEDIGKYYVSLPFGDRAHFLYVLESSGLGYKAERWRRVFRLWAEGHTQGKPLNQMQQETLESLLHNHHWRKEYSKLLQNMKKNHRNIN